MPAGAPVTPLIARRGYLRLGKESTWGQAVAATIDLPTHTRQIDPVLTKVSADVTLNTRSRDFIVLNGRRWAAGRIGGPAFGTSFGNVLMGVLGADAVTASPGAPTGLATSPSASGGTLATLTYGYKVSAVSGAGETVASSEVTAAVTGPNGSVKLTWNEVPGAIGYNVYGRTTGGELKMLQAAPYNYLVGSGAGVAVTVPGGVTTFTDTGAITPSGALPGGGTFGPRHLFTPANTLPSYSAEQNRGGFGTSEQYAGCIFGKLDLSSKFDANDGVLDWVATILGAFPTTISATAFNKPTDKYAVAPKASMAYGGLSWAKVMEVALNIDNTEQEIKVANSTLDINNAIGTSFKVSGTARVVFDAFTAGGSSQGIGEYTDWSANNGLTLSIVYPFEDGASFEVILKSAILRDWKFRDSGPEYVEASFGFTVQDPITNLSLALANAQGTTY